MHTVRILGMIFLHFWGYQFHILKKHEISRQQTAPSRHLNLTFPQMGSEPLSSV